MAFAISLDVNKRELSKRKTMLKKMQQDMPGAYLRAIYDEAVKIFEDSQERVPVDSGDLRASGRLTPPTRSDPEAEISYDTTLESSKDYAMAVHEGYEKTFEHGKEAGFLINAWHKVVNTKFDQRLRDATRENYKAKKGIRGVKGRKGSKGPLARKG
jgi:hypothetical protein